MYVFIFVFINESVNVSRKIYLLYTIVHKKNTHIWVNVTRTRFWCSECHVFDHIWVNLTRTGFCCSESHIVDWVYRVPAFSSSSNWFETSHGICQTLTSKNQLRPILIFCLSSFKNHFQEFFKKPLYLS